MSQFTQYRGPGRKMLSRAGTFRTTGRKARHSHSPEPCPRPAILPATLLYPGPLHWCHSRVSATAR